MSNHAIQILFLIGVEFAIPALILCGFSARAKFRGLYKDEQERKRSSGWPT